MGWQRREEDSDNDVLMRVVALLVSLAALAEFAAAVPARRRANVLCYLMRGEAEARAFIIQLASGGMAFPVTQTPAEAFAIAGDVPFSSSDAAHCAIRLRALALVLCLLLAGASAPPTGTARLRIAAQNPLARIAIQHAALSAPDTS